jgi:PilZ domain
MATSSHRPSTDNRRRASRIEKDFSVTMSTPALGEQTIRARNLSAGGILVDVPAQLPAGTQVQITFTVPESASAFVATGEVTEVRAEAAGTSATAVQFTQIACV